MQTFETIEPNDARRCRYAQFGGRPVVTLCGAHATGIVHLIMEIESSTTEGVDHQDRLEIGIFSTFQLWRCSVVLGS